MDTVTMTQAEYQALIDSRDHAVAMREVATGKMPTLTEAELDAFLAAASPLAYWRERNGLSIAGLAAQAGVSEAALRVIEHGGTGDVGLFARIAATLGMRIEDIAPVEPNGEDSVR